MRRSVVKSLPLCEFREPDGSYVLVRPYDDVRCRVIDSNVFRKGELLHLRGAAYGWSEGSEDIGGCTRVGLAFLLQDHSALVDGHPDDLLNLLAEQEAALADHRLPDPEEEVVDPRSLAPDEPEMGGADLRATLTRLTDHYRKIHGYGQNTPTQVTACSCPGFGPGNYRARDLLAAVVTLALRHKSLPPLRDLIRQARHFGWFLDVVARRPRERVA
jgi:hypothetical protein